jgi:catechol 2,3-dioxygenase-like lactoylglutathione lyase family enzyme
MPGVVGVLETCLYVEDLERAGHFYEDLFSVTPMAADERFRGYAIGDRSVLLLFRRGATRGAISVPGGVIPGHDGAGQNHMAFAIAQEEHDAWKRRLEEKQIAMESTVRWPRGGQSLYFRDPDGNLLELAMPGLWPTY